MKTCVELKVEPKKIVIGFISMPGLVDGILKSKNGLALTKSVAEKIIIENIEEYFPQMEATSVAEIKTEMKNWGVELDLFYKPGMNTLRLFSNVDYKSFFEAVKLAEERKEQVPELGLEEVNPVEVKEPINWKVAMEHTIAESKNKVDALGYSLKTLQQSIKRFTYISDEEEVASLLQANEEEGFVRLF